jgi:predicted flavoprotein YhiN
VADNHQIIVVGAGAAGMMAAGRAGELGTKVLLIEKMDRPGKKILLTGNGKCNLSNCRDMDSFIAQFGLNGSFLRGSFSRFFRDDLLDFLRSYNIDCKIAPGGKIYPATENARDIVRAFQHYLDDGKVNVQLGVAATGIVAENGRVSGVSTTNGNLPASAVIMATGGSCHPLTGSTGDGFRMAEELGHTVIKLRPGLVPLVTTNSGLNREWRGARLRNVRVTAFSCPSEKIDPGLIPDRDIGRGISSENPRTPIIESRTGYAIIVHFGLSGPVIMDMSLAIVDALNSGPVSVNIDLQPQKNCDTLRSELQSIFDRLSHDTYRNIIRHFLSRMLVKPFVAMTGIPADKLGSQITTEERVQILNRLKSLRFDIQGAHSMSTAMVTAGGISLKEINPGTMVSRLVEGLYFCGEIMDLDAGTGGYNLQAAFSTGYVAGENAAFFVRGERSVNRSSD